MSIDELKAFVLNGQQHYFNKVQVIQLLDELTNTTAKKSTDKIPTLFDDLNI